MFRTGQLLQNDAEFDRCIWFNKLVDIWFEGERVETRCFIEKFTDEVIKINGGYYLRQNIQIKIS
jgi:hypothetical protein